jgi:hypothetical protein
MMEAARTSETSVDNYFTRQYIPEDNSELHTRRREKLKSHMSHLKFHGSRKGEKEKLNLPPFSFFLSSFCGPYTGLSHQGQRPKTIVTTVTTKTVFSTVPW